MTKPGHNKLRLIVKIALVVTHISLFATQLSYKYYYLASFPYYSSVGKAASGHQKIGPIMPGAKGVFVLSLDKRYGGKQLYAHPTPVIRVNPPLPAAIVYAECVPDNILHTTHITATQRGPPIAA